MTTSAIPPSASCAWPVCPIAGLWAPAFTPPSPGFYSEYLGIFSNDSIDPPGMYAFLPLEGTGVSATVPVPGALLLGGVGAAIVGLVRRRVA
mgnify:CR=1 FL=1